MTSRQQVRDPAMSFDKYAQILDLLVEKTDSGKLDWKETGDESRFVVSFPNYSVLIGEERGGSEVPDYFISIVNSEGKIVDSFSNLGPSLNDLSEHPTIVMQDLFNKARRRALRVDDALDNIIAHLAGATGR